jgi:MYXO-CTERM domain-containing protein
MAGWLAGCGPETSPAGAPSTAASGSWERGLIAARSAPEDAPPAAADLGQTSLAAGENPSKSPVWLAGPPLIALDGAGDDRFGQAVALSGDTAVVGAPYDEVGAEVDQGAVYVYARIAGVWVQEQRLTSSDGLENDLFGCSVALHGDTLVASACWNAVGPNATQGSAYVFVRSGGTWAELQKLTASDGRPGDYFGGSVAISDETIAIGAEFSDTPGNSNQGAVYVFVRHQGLWTEQQKLLASDGGPGHRLGTALDLDGDTLVAGTATNSFLGAAYVFVRDQGLWTEQQKLVPSSGALDDFFGMSLSLSGDTIVVGAFMDDAGASANQGSAYVYSRSGITWTEQQKLTASDGAEGDNFGLPVDLAGDRLVIGARNSDSPLVDQGSAYLFTRSLGAWTEHQKLTAPDGAGQDLFGISAALSGDTLLVGASQDDVGVNPDQGSAYVFVDQAGHWTPQQKLLAGDLDGRPGDLFGASLALSGGTAIAGAVWGDVAGHVNQGSAYVFVHNSLGWGLQQKLTAPDGGAHDGFGGAVALSGDTAVVGARTDEEGRGSAYVFARQAGIWSLQQRLVAADGQPGDEFGISVRLDGDTLAVGAYGDDGARGSVYLFTLSGGTWSEQQKLTAADAESGDGFGLSLALSGDTLVVGAYQDDVGAATDQGSAYVFTRSAGIWAEHQQLVSSDGAAGDGFGYAAALADGVLLVGAYQDDVGASTDQGSLYVFTPNSGLWAEQQKLTSSDGAAGDAFGSAVAISGARILVGSRASDILGQVDQGAAYVFALESGLWAERQKLVARDGSAGDSFGCSVALAADLGLAGAALDNLGAGLYQGSIHTFFERGSTGDACASAGTCLSGFCVDGVCCDRECGGGNPTDCMACSVAGGGLADGACGPLRDDAAPAIICRTTAGPCDLEEACDSTSTDCPQETFQPAGTTCRAAAGPCDREEVCTGSSAPCPPDSFLTAGTECRPAAGECDVVETCSGNRAECPIDFFQPAGSGCRPAACADGVGTAPAFCPGGSAACPPETSRPCAPYACGLDACLTSCATASDCAPGFDCEAGVCVSGGAEGDPCVASAECDSGFCTDGFCCDAACDGQCEACDAAGAEGTCVPVTGAPHGGRAACAGTGVCQGSCDGEAREACAFPAAGTPCSASACEAGLFTPAGSCDGAGSCSVGSQRACAPYACGDGVCLTSCADAADCVDGYDCVEATCQQPGGSSGCGCGSRGGAGGSGWLALLALAALWARRRRG